MCGCLCLGGALTEIATRRIQFYTLLRAGVLIVVAEVRDRYACGRCVCDMHVIGRLWLTGAWERVYVWSKTRKIPWRKCVWGRCVCDMYVIDTCVCERVYVWKESVLQARPCWPFDSSSWGAKRMCVWGRYVCDIYMIGRLWLTGVCVWVCMCGASFCVRNIWAADLCVIVLCGGLEEQVSIQVLGIPFKTDSCWREPVWSSSDS